MIVKKALLLVFSILILTICRAQYSYTDFLLHDSCIWALTTGGFLKFLDNKNGKVVNRKISSNGSISCIALNNAGDVICVNNLNEVCKYVSGSDTWEVIARVNHDSYGIVFTDSDHGYSLTKDGIEDLNSHLIYFPDSSLNRQIRLDGTWGKPYCFHIDKRGIIWLGFGYGEWGGNLYLFNTTTNKFIRPRLNGFIIELWPVKSFFEDSSSTYLSAGLEHMTTTGTIVRFNGVQSTVVLNSESHWKDSNSHELNSMVYGQYIGPATYNPYNNSIYFYSQNGFFRGIKSKDLSNINNWELIIKPKLKWIDGQPDAVGSPMNVLKLEIIDANRFVFLSQEDGIGIFNGKEVNMVN